MSNTLEIKHKVESIDDEYREIRVIKIRRDEGKFIPSSARFLFDVYDSTNSVSAFSVNISGNGKELIAWFTFDAFSVFSGLVNVESGGNIFNEVLFQDVDINNDTEALSDIEASLNAPPGDSIWLDSIN